MAMRIGGRSEAKRLLKASGVVRSLPSSITSPLSDVDEAQVGVFVAEVQSGCHLRLFFATIIHGPILLPGPHRARIVHLQTQRVLRIRGSAFSSHLPNNPPDREVRCLGSALVSGWCQIASSCDYQVRKIPAKSGFADPTHPMSKIWSTRCLYALFNSTRLTPFSVSSARKRSSESSTILGRTSRRQTHGHPLEAHL